MKQSQKYLGHQIQLYLLRRGYQVEDLSRQAGMTPEALSNLIHGRRRFKDDTLERLARTPILQEGKFSLRRLKALRAMDEYDLAELLLAIVEYVKNGEIEHLPDDFFSQLREELDTNGFPPALSDKKHALFELIQSPRQ